MKLFNSYKELFNLKIEEQLNNMMLEERINQYDRRRASKIDLASIDVAITILLNHARKNWKGEEKEFHALCKNFCAGPS